MATEIELRARISEVQERTLREELATGLVEVQSRCFIDYSTFIEGIGERVLDVRVRVTNGSPEFVVKRGQFGGAKRDEAIARVLPADLDGALSVMALLGYAKGVAGGRRIFRGVIGDIEVAIQEVLNFQCPTEIGDRFVEAEYVGKPTDDKSAEAALNEFLGKRGIKAFIPDEWNEYVAMLNKSWNGVYVHGETPTEIIRLLGEKNI